MAHPLTFVSLCKFYTKLGVILAKLVILRIVTAL